MIRSLCMASGEYSIVYQLLLFKIKGHLTNDSVHFTKYSTSSHSSSKTGCVRQSLFIWPNTQNQVKKMIRLINLLVGAPSTILACIREWYFLVFSHFLQIFCVHSSAYTHYFFAHFYSGADWPTRLPGNRRVDQHSIK